MMTRHDVIPSLVVVIAFAISFSAWAERIAVVVHGASEVPLQNRIVQTRLEEVLMDNGVELVDREKIAELKREWQELEDPTLFITAEDIIERQQRYRFDRLLAAYVKSDVLQGVGGVHLASAHVDLRLVDADAKVAAFSSMPMGTVQVPVSEGVTQNSALVNALRRATESSVAKSGFEVYDLTINRSVRLKLTRVAKPSAVLSGYSISINEDSDLLATLQKSADRKTRLRLNCSVRVDGTQLFAMGVKATKTSLMSGSRSHASMVYLYDAEGQNVLNSFNIESSGRRAAGEKKKSYRSDIEDCEFVNSWKYLAVSTRNQLKLFEVERGIELASFSFSKAMKNNQIKVLRAKGGDYLQLSSPGHHEYFKVGL